MSYYTDKSAGFLLLIGRITGQKLHIVLTEAGSLRVPRLLPASLFSRCGLSAPALLPPELGIQARIDLDFMMWQRMVLGLAPDKKCRVLNVPAKVQ